MNQQSFGQKLGQKLGRATEAGPGGTSAGGAGAGTDGGPGASGPRTTAKPGTTNQAVLGPFTVRDLAVFAATLILFVASLLPIFGGRFNLWNAGSLFFLGLGMVLPLIVSALFAARRLAPATRIRIGSLSIDQFASVVASFAVAFFFLTVASAYAHSLLVGLIGAVVLFAATVLARFIPYFAGDFLGRKESPAHVLARESAVPLPKPHTPKAPKPAAAAHHEAVNPHATPHSYGTAGPQAAPVATGAAAGSSASQVGAPAAHAGSSAVPSATSPTGAVPAAAGSGTVPAAAGAGSAAAVSSAAEMTEWSVAGDRTPATQAAYVVPPASRASAAEETQAGNIPTAAAGAAATGGVMAGTAASGSATAGTSASGTSAPEAAGSPAAWEPAPATVVHQQVRSQEPIGATVDPASRPEESDELPVHEAFWFAVAQHRTAFDPQTGAPAFVIEPGGWVLALEDRGHEFLVQHTDGRLGVLRDLSNIERG
ncbi:hypothetical protein F8G81_19210 [Arthrobacter sp. CDRTa11]|uniref:hypothetical protein n=1 Tax=Arthrobacter sp. CDRTa11 TaxID=2651199 RepID=UPI002265FA19|nr:hypothetical protein [Arthrobacter sp. CDRTa11]UZX04496.1 hypothetical protein F8G81_19210 [Arthrobacter sp. CDRTa11]